MGSIQLRLLLWKRWLLCLCNEVDLAPIMFSEVSVRLRLVLKVANIITIHNWFKWWCINSYLKCLARIIRIWRATKLLVVWLKVLLLLVNYATMVYCLFVALKWQNIFSNSWVVSNLEIRVIVLQLIIVVGVVVGLYRVSWRFVTKLLLSWSNKLLMLVLSEGCLLFLVKATLHFLNVLIIIGLVMTVERCRVVSF